MKRKYQMQEVGFKILYLIIVHMTQILSYSEKKKIENNLIAVFLSRDSY